MPGVQFWRLEELLSSPVQWVSLWVEPKSRERVTLKFTISISHNMTISCWENLPLGIHMHANWTLATHQNIFADF